MQRAAFAQALPVERLAAVAGMSPSSFHQHFRRSTSLSPLQFQKQLRLIEARPLRLPQFTREYGRLFGLSPVRHTEAARSQARAAA